ncbi:MAG: M1 family metallopeptidase [Bacteroidetes bacterium]|nr:M1 family metallopeptidase [Bacteroidota bacterium]
MKKLFTLFFTISALTIAQPLHNPGSNHANRFEQLNYLLPTPNEYRTASGAAGNKYWQQRADYDINCEIDEENNILIGSETITYFNNSPDALTYLWIQLDENFHHPNSDNNRINTSKMGSRMNHDQLRNLEPQKKLDGYGINILKIVDKSNNPLKYKINQTMMRIDLSKPLSAGDKFIIKIDWNYKLNNKDEVPGRGGYEFFKEDGNNLYSIVQWFPRMAVYSDFQGWQNKQFLGGSEFTLVFGNYKVKITTPADHIVAATGECKNYNEMLTSAQFDRWKKAQKSSEPIEVVTLDEATNSEKSKSKSKKTWEYEAENVRDFAFNSSRKFIWDAMLVNINGKKTMAMSYYPKESYNLYKKYSTKVIAHTLKVYGKFSIPYSYPVAISVEAANGMEYPMLSMNYGRCEKDGTYSEAIKYGMIGVIIHEVGHNFYPMIINSDERQWWWMDEGLNTFVQYLTEQEFDNEYPSTRGPAKFITSYMRLPKTELEPIMTSGDLVLQVGQNAYAKAATGLNILRETIMGRDLFDKAFKTYAERWAFKHPTPADLFRTMEDASGVDLDWFWRGWFFGTDPVDISLDSVKIFKLDTNPTASIEGSKFDRTFDIGREINKNDKTIKFLVDEDPSLKDFYSLNPGADDLLRLNKNISANDSSLDRSNYENWKNKFFYELTFTNKGGMLMPIIIEWKFTDGTTEVERIPVLIWRLNEERVTKVFIKNKQVASIVIDPMKETADVDELNNMWPIKEIPSKFQLFKSGRSQSRGFGGGQNAMQGANKPAEVGKSVESGNKK